MSVNVILFIGAAVFGAIIGSFLNALSFRFNTGRTMGGRSRCMHCGHTLAAFDLVPVFSFLFLHAKCRYCGSKISWQYPLVEIAAAALSVLVWLQVSGTVFAYIFWFAVWMTLLFTIVYDIKHTIIPWSCSGLLALLAVLSLFVSFSGGAVHVAYPTLWAVLAGPLLALPLFCLSLVSRGSWMGWGDSALELSLGWLLGLSAGLTALMLAFWSGALVGILIILYQRLPWQSSRSRLTIKSEMPFAPFLALGALIAHFLHVDFFSTFGSLW